MLSCWRPLKTLRVRMGGDGGGIYPGEFPHPRVWRLLLFVERLPGAFGLVN